MPLDLCSVGGGKGSKEELDRGIEGWNCDLSWEDWRYGGWHNSEKWLDRDT